MNLTPQEFFGLAASSGAAAGLANQLFKFLHDLLAERRRGRAQDRELEHQKLIQDRELEQQTTSQKRGLDHQRELQREEREHQAELRREADFYDARRAHVPGVSAVYGYIQWWWGELYGDDVDYHPRTQNRPELVQSTSDALAALAELAGSHPLKPVRIFAWKLHGNIDSTVNSTTPGGYSDPTMNQLSDWSKRTLELVDALHDPQHRLE
ncbi:hypothetical protein [Ornithinimicrobium cavernae]|uniref:hypothetical protein n=1 Tax=Ornithinimicrobium cavernae TaxID=2666047 RepID=UPI000D68ADC5|nr:hypothetical protein [Ornithinimicrobium cavernae]